MANTIIKLTEVEGKEVWVNVDEFIILKMEEDKEKGCTGILYCHRWRSGDFQTINVIEKPEYIVESIKNG